MNRLFFYGCSFGLCRHPVDKNIFDNSQSICDFIAKDSKLVPINRSKPGADAYTLFQKFINDIRDNHIERDDQVIFQLPFISRAKIASNRYGKAVMPIHSDKIAKTYYKHFYLEEQNLSQIVGLMLIADKLCPCKFFFTFVDGAKRLNAVHHEYFKIARSLPQYLKVFDDSIVDLFNKDNYYPCHHPLPEANKQISEWYKVQLYKKNL